MSTRTVLASLVLMAGSSGSLLAQQAPPDGPPDFAEMRQRMADRMKEMVGATDDEWKALQPKIEKIQQLQRDAAPRSGPMFGGPGGRGGPGGGPGGPPQGFGGPGGNQTPSAVQEKVKDLREALNNKDTPIEEINAKTKAVRDARAQAKSDLGAAEEDLKVSVTPRQQAALLAMGILE